MAYAIKLFGEADFSGLAEGVRHAISQQIIGENPDYLLNTNETQYVQHVIDKYSFTPLVIQFDHMEATPVERKVPAERFPQFAFFVEGRRSYVKPAFVYHVPFGGDPELLKCIPNPRVLNTYRVQVDKGEISFEIVDFYGDAQRVKQEADSIISYIREQSGHLDANVRQVNHSLPDLVKRTFDERKAKLLQHRQAAANLGVPIRKNPNVPATFAVPATVRKVVSPKPSSSAGPYRAEPTIDDAIYTEILQAIQNTGRMFERLPSVYAAKDEEALRDHLLMVLEPLFQIASTGETFNKGGKTDILMRYEGKNVFVAECKFWGGAKKHHETIDQILSYLTFRDSKTAIVYFMDTKEMAAPLNAVAETTPKHADFVAYRGRREETWFAYEFHLPGDPGRSLQLAILCFSPA